MNNIQPELFENQEKSNNHKNKINLKMGNALNLIKDIPDKSVDLIIMDPPYLFAKHGGGGMFGSRNRQYHNELDNSKITDGYDLKILDELIRVMKKVNIYIFCSKEQIKDYLVYFADYNMDLLTWHKTNPVPTCNNKYLSDTEYILFFRDKGVKVYGDYHSKHKYFVTATNKADKIKYHHPTIKPLDIIKTLIINSSKENEIVLDPYMGTGTTAVACLQTNRDFIGYEINEAHYKTAIDRVKEEVQ